MEGRAVKPAEEDFREMQGLIRFGYRLLTEASFLLLRVRDAEAARRWLRAAPVADAVERPAAPETALHVALTREGMEALGVESQIVEQFSLEFLGGMAGDAGRSRLLGDVGRNAPEGWSWGVPGATPHVLVMLYAKPGKMHAWAQQAQGEWWDKAFEVMKCLPTSNLGDREPFGFKDSVSQPALDWKGARRVEAQESRYSNLVSLGEFVLGYPNEYGRYTGRPLLAATEAMSDDVPIASEAPGMRDLGRNGCYLVLRTLQQDVEGFWQFARAIAGEQASSFAAAMVGRTQDGKPLVPLSEEAIPGVHAQDASLNQFTFDGDPRGEHCPFGAHVRRANPRNADLPTPPVEGFEKALRVVGLGHRDLHSDSKASARFHRILRRGREFGPAAAQGDAGETAKAAEARGIHFMCLVANIGRQFEFLQSAWMMSSKFDSMTDESDPLLGNREPVCGALTDAFSHPRENGLRDRVTGVPQFVTVRGGAYFFLPSLVFLRYIAGENERPAAAEGQR